jgi:hypothetical protein
MLARIRQSGIGLRCHRQSLYALHRRQGRKELILYDVTDPLTVTWARLCVERRGFVSCGEALDLTGERWALFRTQGTASMNVSLLKVRRSKPASAFGGRNQTP